MINFIYYKMDDFNFNVPIFFTKTNVKIKKLIKNQGYIVCRDEFDKGYINSSLSTFSHGFIILSKIANIGKSNKGTLTNYLVKGFILFTYDEYSNKIDGKLLCGRKSLKGIGLTLLEETKKFVNEKKVTTWRILSLPNYKLLNFYEKFGFIRETSFYNSNNELKTIELTQRFNYVNTLYLENDEFDNNISENEEDDDNSEY